MKALHRIIAQARAVPKHIVLCEGGDARVLQAAARAAAEGLAHITIVGQPAAILALAQEHALDLDAVRLVDPAQSSESEHYAQQLFVLRQAKGMTVEQARTAVQDPLCYANLMVRLGDADGCVAGAVHTTADVVRSAIQIIGVDPAFKLVSSFFLMMLCEPFHSLKGGFIFSDCALVVDPKAEELADIAMAAADLSLIHISEPTRPY